MYEPINLETHQRETKKHQSHNDQEWNHSIYTFYNCHDKMSLSFQQSKGQASSKRIHKDHDPDPICKEWVINHNDKNVSR